MFLSKAWEKVDITGGYMFIAPTGKYETGSEDNVGIGYWSHLFQVAGYYYLLDKASALMLTPTYEFHGRLKDVDVTPGSRFILEYGISQYFTEKLELTLQGGHAWQTGKDAGNDVYWDTSVKDQMSTFGLGAGYWLFADQFYANLKWNTTYGNREHFKVNSFELQLLYIPKALTKPN